MKNIYNAPNKEVAAAELDNLEKKWGGKYPYAILSWRNKWDDLTVFFQFPLEIRKIIYTTNLIENLNGFTDTIRTVFPQSSTQICVVHQIRNSCKYVVYKDKKEFATDMKNIYNAPNKEVAATELDNLEKKWGGKYPYAILSWRNNWDDLTVFFQFPLEIRKIIYTTNLIENLNWKIRKYTKSKLSFPSDDAVKKMVYLSLMEIEKKWTQPIHNWGLIMNQFMLMFENRIQI